MHFGKRRLSMSLPVRFSSDIKILILGFKNTEYIISRSLPPSVHPLKRKDRLPSVPSAIFPHTQSPPLIFKLPLLTPPHPFSLCQSALLSSGHSLEYRCLMCAGCPVRPALCLSAQSEGADKSRWLVALLACEASNAVEQSL